MAHGSGGFSLGGEKDGMVSVKFEVHGRVQGVFFRAHTQEQAQQMGLTGWVQNMPGGTVMGEVQGSSGHVEKMLHWLRHVGSPQSRIDKLDIVERKVIAEPAFASFEVRRRKR
ncbi:acylphosphatase family protein [Besnoitia besnoiti]|uniref:Acylphosphatase n=1 Tax=Besnoitia besnoiti TaxID=94643 RepID=A0A2A9MIW4_BESBE|nr:acylphosphatase family protein [Besnoitia besnoiti]PFH37915.1 acylphosphatase family protein [Besnoitia besnoiti]